MPAQVITVQTTNRAGANEAMIARPGVQAGSSISNAGDFNGDGFDDFIIGAPSPSRSAYLFFGGVDVLPISAGGIRTLFLDAFSSRHGVIISSVNSTEFATNVSAAGDINGDGIDDIIISSPAASFPGESMSGAAYVVLGRRNFALNSSGTFEINLSSVSSADGFLIRGDAAGDRASVSISGAGDINGDGIDDLIVGASAGDDGGTNAGEAYVIFGRTTGFGTMVSGFQTLDLTTLAPTDGFIIQGDTDSDSAGRSVSDAGDINGDGIGDLIVTATGGDDGGAGAGEAYVIFGRTTGFGTTVGGRQVMDLTSLSASDGFIIQGDAEGDGLGSGVSNAGDLNGDGIDDLIIGASLGDDGGTSAGEAYVIFGRSAGFGTSINGRQVIDLTTLSASDGFIIQGDDANNRVGFSVSAAGDVNGDGLDDVIIGAPGGNNNGSNSGEAYIIFGKRGGFGTNIGGRQVVDLSNLSQTDALIIQSTALSYLGYAVTAAGDINRDGFDDVIIGASGGLTSLELLRGNGVSYVIFGSGSYGRAPAIDGTGGSDSLIGTAGADTLNGLDGNDVLDGGSGADALNGGKGDDIYLVDDAGDAVTEAASEGTDRVETALAAYTLSANVENLEYTGATAFNGTGNALANIIVGRAGGDTLSGLDGDDNLGGEAGDDVLDGGNGNDRLIGGTGSDTLNGGAGDDILVVDANGDIANGGNGIDTVELGTAGLFFTIGSDIEKVSNTSGGEARVTLNALANTYGGSAGFDRVFAGAGNDMAYGRGGGDILIGEDGNDRLFGEAGNDVLNGGNGVDLLYGGADNDQLEGGSGNDTLYGEAGNDIITGSAGLDSMNGGLGADTFRFNAGDTGATMATADRIQDFSSAQGDRIDLSGAGSFSSFIGTAAFSNTAGEFRTQQIGGNTYVLGDANGDGVTDLMIRLDGLKTLSANDFILID